jgi:peptidoglycan/xylan/chitin deacetylase (PgdA/CDA1 family)
MGECRGHSGTVNVVNHQKIKGVTSSVVNRLGVLNVYASLKSRRVGSEVAVVVYHRVSPHDDRWSVDILSPRSFESQLEYMCCNYDILALDEVVRYIHEGKRLPKRAVAITLDDGYKDNFLYAFPLLKKYHVPATIFLATGHIGSADLFWWDKIGYALERTQRRGLNLAGLGSFEFGTAAQRRGATLTIIERLKKLPDQRKNFLIDELLCAAGVDIPESVAKEVILSWEDVLRMSEAGIELGAHSVGHPILTNMPLEKAKREIVESKRDIEKMVKEPVDFFSYPDGSFNSEIIKAVEQSGFVGAVTCDPVWITPRTGRYEIGRMVIGSEDFNMFRVMLSGIWGDYGGLSKRLKMTRKQHELENSQY